MQQPQVGTSCECSRNRKKLVWLQHAKGREEQGNVKLEDKQESDHVRTVGQGRRQNCFLNSVESTGGGGRDKGT